MRQFLGMSVVYTPGRDDPSAFAGQVVLVNDDGTVNLVVFTHSGEPTPRLGVRYVVAGEDKPEYGAFCERNGRLVVFDEDDDPHQLDDEPTELDEDSELEVTPAGASAAVAASQSDSRADEPIDQQLEAAVKGN